MKYSLRSLMTFSIRDLALVTMIAAILTAWWLDHRQLVEQRKRDKETIDVYERLANSKADYNKVRAEQDKAVEAQHRIAKLMLEQARKANDESRDDLRDSGEGGMRGYTLLGPPLPNSQAPAQNSPKK